MTILQWLTATLNITIDNELWDGSRLFWHNYLHVVPYFLWEIDIDSLSQTLVEAVEAVEEKATMLMVVMVVPQAVVLQAVVVEAAGGM